MNASSTIEYFSAAQIAQALGKAPRQVRRWLDDVREDGTCIVQHKPAKVWRLASLPAAMRQELEALASRNGCRNVEQLLAEPAVRWEPRVPLAQCSDACISQARRLQTALASALALRNDPKLSGAELAAIGRRDFKAAFGYEVTARHWRGLFQRTLTRAGADEDFRRLEIYLAEKIKARTAAIPSAKSEEFAAISDTLQSFSNPAVPTAMEVQALWDQAFSLLTDSTDPAGVKPRLVRFLFAAAPFLASSFDALRKQFERKHDRWLAAGSNPVALRDQRKEKTRFQITAEDRDNLIGHAVFKCGGRVSQAFRELRQTDGFTPDLQGRTSDVVASKSYVPKSVRQAVAAEVKTLRGLTRKRGIETIIPPLDLSYEDIASMHCLQSDDVTLPVYFYVPDGQGWYQLTRGQFLPAIDFRSLKILTFALHPEGQYNSTIIRTVFTRAFADYGLPNVLYLERGIWKRSKLIVGARADDTLPLSDAECEVGLRAFGIKFIHAFRARSKPVERVAGLLQDLMEREPGYCGRQEIKDRPEWLDRQMQEVQARKVHPGKYFYDLDQWEARLHEICEQYNATPQQGKRLDGISPDRAFECHWPKHDPPARFDASCRYLLAHHKIPVEVKTRGISFRLNAQTYRFFDEQTGRRIGQRLVAWFNPELPDICTFTTMDRQEAFTVARHQSTNALETDARFESETANAAAHASPLRTRYRVLKARFKPVFRGNIVAAETVELGREMERQRAAVVGKQRQQSDHQTKARQLARATGIRAETLRRPEQLEAAERLAQLLKEDQPESEEPQ